MAKNTAYAESLKDPRWQKKRLEILDRDSFTCSICDDTTSTLYVHHKYYIVGRLPWEYPNFCYATLCGVCHDIIHEWPSVAREKTTETGVCEFTWWEKLAEAKYRRDREMALLAVMEPPEP